MDDTNVSKPQGEAAKWLLLITQLPAKPDYLRVKLRRRIQRTGAVPLKNAVYLLPYSEAAMEDFAWVRAELLEDGADAVIWAANAVLGTSDEQLGALFRAAAPSPAGEAVHGRTWVTRSGVFVDRMASAWLIRRFIDTAAQFKFVSATRYRPLEGELRFDMFEGEYTHEGDRCTFETLVSRFALDDPALHEIAQIVHDIDLKDGKFARPECSGVESILSGIVAVESDDSKRISQAGGIFDSLYAQRR